MEEARLNNLHQDVIDRLGDIATVIFDNDFYITLVGGAVRDYYLNQILGNDLDFEIRGDKNKLKQLKSELGSICKLEELTYGVFRLKRDENEFEFSLPRLEKFIEGQKGHGNFVAEFYGDLPYEKAFARRDFTFNAIGLELENENEGGVVDPFNGISDLKRKYLMPCSDSFYKDPVRILRGVRFLLNLDLEITPVFESHLKMADLSQITPHYVQYEFFKTIPEKRHLFFPMLFIWSDNFQLKLPEKLLKLKNLDFNCMHGKAADSLLESALCLIVHEQNEQPWVEYFDLPNAKINGMKELVKSYNEFISLGKVKIHKTWNDDRKLLEKLSRFQSSYKKNENEKWPLKLFREMDPKALKQLEELALLKKLEGDELFQKMLAEDQVENKDKSLLRMWCHLKARK